MIHSISRFCAVLLTSTALLPSIAGAETRTAKLDETLRESLERGCVGTQSVIITVAAGYREGLRQALAAHGDVVTGEFPALDAIAATVHCADLNTLAAFGSIRAVSTNATVGVSSVDGVSTGTSFETAIRTFARDIEGTLARELKKTEFATLGVTKFRDIKPSGPMLVEAGAGLTDDAGSAVFGAPATMAGHGIGVAVIDSGIEPGTDFDNRITAFYDFTSGDIRAVTAHDDYGHGTHVAGLIGSEFVGVAPYSRLIGLKVLNNLGQGTTADVVRAIEFAITNRHLLGINILNLSLGHPIYEHAATDPLVQAVEHAARVGLTVVVAAGNFGANPKTGERRLHRHRLAGERAVGDYRWRGQYVCDSVARRRSRRAVQLTWSIVVRRVREARYRGSRTRPPFSCGARQHASPNSGSPRKQRQLHAALGHEHGGRCCERRRCRSAAS